MPRLMCAASFFGFRRSASRYSAMAPSKSPLLARATPRLSCASSLLGFSAAPRGIPRSLHPGRPYSRARRRGRRAPFIVGVQAHRFACCGLRHRPTSSADPGHRPGSRKGRHFESQVARPRDIPVQPRHTALSCASSAPRATCCRTSACRACAAGSTVAGFVTLALLSALISSSSPPAKRTS